MCGGPRAALRRDAHRVQVDRAGRRGREPLVYGYEEALGYCVAPEHVRDKDGITAALTVAELAAGLKAEGRTLADRLDELAAEFGVHPPSSSRSGSRTWRDRRGAMARIRGGPPTALLGAAGDRGADLLPDADVRDRCVPARPGW